MNAHTKRKIRKFFSPFRRIGLKNKNFSIISNNCWGGIVYDILGLQYQSPTIGCFMHSKDYLKFISNLNYYLSLDCIPCKLEETEYLNILNYNSIPTGKIDDIIIFFLHYDNINDACIKWNKRKKRVNFNNLLIKYSDQNMFDIEDYYSFNKLEYKNKLFITSNSSLMDNNNVVYLKRFKKYGYAIDDIKPSFKKIKLIKLLNELED